MAVLRLAKARFTIRGLMLAVAGVAGVLALVRAWPVLLLLVGIVLVMYVPTAMVGMTTASPRRPLTLRRLMGAVAAAAVCFALLPLVFAAPLAVAVCGVIVLDGMRPPIVTEGGGVQGWLPWAVWLLFLAACPIAACVVAAIYPHVGPPRGPLPWAARAVEALFCAHLGVLAVAAIVVVVLTRGRRRCLAWAIVFGVGVMGTVASLFAWMDTSGWYL